MKYTKRRSLRQALPLFDVVFATDFFDTGFAVDFFPAGFLAAGFRGIGFFDIYVH